MFNFLKDRSYEIVKMFINQVAIGIFGLSISLATATIDDEAGTSLKIITSVFAILFYLFIIYNMVRSLGYRDSGRINRGEDGASKYTGLYLGLAASTLNFLFAIFIMLAHLTEGVKILSWLGGVSAFINLITEGMYIGLLSMNVGGAPLNSYWPVYFVILIPMIVTSTLAYLAGVYDVKIFNSKKAK